jgi:serine/threonine-protein kinase
LTERLARERDILASLEHAHIARLYDAGVDGKGRPYLAMEYVDGVAVDVYCRDQALPLRARIGLLLQVAAAVAHAHSRLVVHRDLKPGNILVTADGQVRLLDFGIAKLMEVDRTEATSLTHLSGRALTLDYASPEQIRSEPLGTASDVYSLAVVAYELLVGARPYRLKRSSAAELEEAITSIDPPLASDLAREPALRRQLKGDLDAILNKALKKDSSQRYATVEALADDLRRHLDQQPVLAQPDRLGYRASKFVSRHRFQVAAGVVAALALVAGAGVALWQAQHARAQAAHSEEVNASCCPSSRTPIQAPAAAARRPPSICWNRRGYASPRCR